MCVTPITCCGSVVVLLVLVVVVLDRRSMRPKHRHRQTHTHTNTHTDRQFEANKLRVETNKGTRQQNRVGDGEGKLTDRTTEPVFTRKES